MVSRVSAQASLFQCVPAARHTAWFEPWLPLVIVGAFIVMTVVMLVAFAGGSDRSQRSRNTLDVIAAALTFVGGVSTAGISARATFQRSASASDVAVFSVSVIVCFASVLQWETASRERLMALAARARRHGDG